MALFAASAWLNEPGVGYLTAWLVATVAGAYVLRRYRTVSGTRWLVAALLALAAAGVVAGRAQARLLRFARDPATVGSKEAAAQRTMLKERLDEEMRVLRAAAHAGRELPPLPRDALGVLDRAIGDREHRAIFVRRNDSLVAWTGRLHADPSQFPDANGIVATPFGLTIYVADDSGSIRTVATSLLVAAMPAYPLTRGLAQRLRGDEVTEGFTFDPPRPSSSLDELAYADGGRTLFIARANVPSAGEVRFRVLERARVRIGVGLLIALTAFLVAVARRGGGARSIVLGAVVVLACIAIVPLSEFSTRSRLFDASVYYFPAGRAFTANAAAVALSSATALLLVLLGVRRIGRRMPRWLAFALAIITIGAGPFAVRALSRGISPPADGANGALWLIWDIPLCLAATALLVLANWAGRRLIDGARGVPPATGPLVALGAAVLAQGVWEAPGQWPPWYSVVWALAVAGVVLMRPTRRSLLACATVAALGATTVVWGSASRGRVDLAERDVRGLGTPDAYAVTLAGRLAESMRNDELPRTSQALLERYVNSALASAGFPVALMAWDTGMPLAVFRSAPFDFPLDKVAAAAMAATMGDSVVTAIERAGAYGVRVIAIPMANGAATIIIAPRTRLIAADAYSRWIGLASSSSNEPLYSVQVESDTVGYGDGVHWRREANSLHGNAMVSGATGSARAQIEVELRTLGTLLPRGALLVLVCLGVVALVWLLGALADGRFALWLRLRRRRIQSYRARLSVALFLFFLVPASAFAVWSWQQLFADAQASRRLLLRETMRSFTGDEASLRPESVRLDTKLLLYRNGVLAAASDTLFADLAPMGRLMRPEVFLSVSEELSATMSENIDGARGMLGYRVIPGTGRTLVISAPARVDDLVLDRRRRDLSVLVLFATALGAAAAFWLSAMAAQQLARPIGALREAARAVARGESDLPLDATARSEFLPVFTAFRAMARDLGESRAELIESQRRTDAVLRTVASGVVAVDERGCVILANPRAEALLGDVPDAGRPLAELDVPAVASIVTEFLRGSAEADRVELELDGRTLRGQITRLTRGGAVLTLDDVTELARAQRVLAWGEMARQVAHEIKNPLTPIRLGVQHLRRAWGREDFEKVLDQNVSRILTEIDRLDEIARSFSRYGGAPEERLPPEPTDVAAIVRDVVALELIGESAVSWRCEVEDALPLALARPDQLNEVLLNLFENARLAGARNVTAIARRVMRDDGTERLRIEVVDDGSGIAADVLPRIFEPHFSTRTSGSGLGLAITRRLVDGWGGEVSIESAGAGTSVRVDLALA